MPIVILCYWTVESAVSYFRSEDLQCMALNIYHEARNESTAGKVAVAQVTLNRVYSDRFPNTVCGVVTQGVYKGGYPARNRCQFSWYCDGLSDNPYDLRAYNKSVEIAQWLLVTQRWLPDLTDGSLFYHADYVSPKWSKVKHRTLQIDQHIFYK